MNPRRLSSTALGLTTLLMVSSAGAHIALDAPVARVPTMGINDDIKTPPCGPKAGSQRTTDPSKITTFRPGETITVEWHETIHHPGFYRIQFDDDGQDDFMDIKGPDDIIDPPVLPILKDGIPDKSGQTDTFAVEVTLPNVTCDNCTLQLIQYMTENNRNEPYYQCADLVLAGEPVGGEGTGGTGTGGAEGTGGDDGSGGAPLTTGGTAGASGGSSSASGGALGAATGGAEASGGALSGSGGSVAAGGTASGGDPSGAGGMTMEDWVNSGTDDGGCSLRSPGGSGGFSWFFSLLLIVGVGRLTARRRASAPD